MTDKWFTTQIRVREGAHDYLKAQARASGISITQAAGVLLEHCRRENLEIGPVVVTRQPPIVERKHSEV